MIIGIEYVAAPFWLTANDPKLTPGIFFCASAAVPLDVMVIMAMAKQAAASQLGARLDFIACSSIHRHIVAIQVVRCNTARNLRSNIFSK
jgi:hypothetical protein